MNIKDMNFNLKKENDGDRYSIDDDNEQEDDIHIIRREQKKKKFRKPPPTPPSLPASDDNNSDFDETFEMFSNPNKVHKVEEEQQSQYEEEGPNNENMSVVLSDSNADDFDEAKYEDRPSKGYDTIEDEKADLLYKLSRMSTKGVKMNKKYNVNSNINEMRQEFMKIKRELEVNSSIKFSRRMLMACVTGIEFLNKRYDPFDVHLDGWSESLMENIDDYDNVFERLHDKYKNSVNVPPEMELLMSLAGSAFMFHLTNTMFKSIPNIGDMAKQNPDIMKTMMETMTAAAKQSAQTQQTPTPTPVQQQSNTGEPIREMKKPSFDISSILPSGMMLPMQVIPDIQKPINTTSPTIIEDPKETDSVKSLSPASSFNSSMVSNTKNVTISETKKRGRKSKKPIMNTENTITI